MIYLSVYHVEIVQMAWNDKTHISPVLEINDTRNSVTFYNLSELQVPLISERKFHGFRREPQISAARLFINIKHI